MPELIFKQHVSQLDQSVNFEHRFEDHAGMLEARFVRRVEDYFIVYLSSQTGCKQACRMCWLTATGQTDTRDVTMKEYFEQAERVFDHYTEVIRNDPVHGPAKRVHFNFMARGEPLANKHFIENADEILRGLKRMAAEWGLEAKFLISTIWPKDFGYTRLTDVFTDSDVYPELYYSAYSMNPQFRKQWLPKASSPITALDELKRWQEVTGKTPKIHYAFINDQNDSLGDVKAIIDEIEEIGLRVNWNVVRYNPPAGHWSKETVEGQIHYLAGYIRNRLPETRVKVIPRVGTDVQASCGTFLK
jgi:adenine C2-methylase RlmN of 23S rRNA A2503 and tRNA A37